MHLVKGKENNFVLREAEKKEKEGKHRTKSEGKKRSYRKFVEKKP